MTLASARRRYVTDAIQTVSPQQLIVMLYERLLLDITRAGEALAVGDLETTNNQLTHAQDIVAELSASLDPTVWSGGPTLQELYHFLQSELVAANVAKDPTRIATCQSLVEPLVEAWRGAAAQLAEVASPIAGPPVDGAPVAGAPVAPAARA